MFVSSCGDGNEAEPARKHSPRCVAPPGVSNQPLDIAQTVELVNALPKPLTLPCFVESLARPLRAHASRSQVSAQPAVGQRSPRLFLFVGANIMTIVPAGIGSHLLEMGEQRADFRSLKAEIEFPVTAQLAPEDPFTHVMFNEQVTNCAFCHAVEQQDPSVPFTRAFASEALRPRLSEHVPLGSVRAELETCDAALEPERCSLLDSLFGWGQVDELFFPDAMPVFGG